jgi:adenosylhomocysteine nucleosidase
MKRVALIAALPSELKPLVRDWAHRRRNGIDLWRQTVGRTEWVAACAGAGPEAAGRAFHEALLTGPFARVYSVGLAGALRPELKAGTVHVVSGVIDTATTERFVGGGSVGGERIGGGARPPGALAPPTCCLLTHHRVANQAEKEQLSAAYGGDLVDMEAAEIARQAVAHGIEFHCLKGISDELTDRLPDLNRFITPTGRFQLGRFVIFAAFRPQHWPALIRLGRSSRRAAAGLAEQVKLALNRTSAPGGRAPPANSGSASEAAEYD